MTQDLPLRFDQPVTLVGDGAFDRAMLEEARALGPTVIAADGAADRLAALGVRPAAVIGDLDSIGPEGRAAADRIVALDEQDTTDFEKCLYATRAPLYLAVGFTGRRLDHTLAALHVLLARPEARVVLVGEAEAIATVPPGVTLCLGLAPGARVSIFPLRPVTGRSTGLRWPLDGLALAPGGAIATSNEAVGGDVTLRFENPGALVMLERPELALLASVIGSVPRAATADRG